MARPTIITEEQVLEAAREIYVRDGINASTIEIAKKAGISEGSIFKRFPTKDALFLAATKTPPVPKWAVELETLVGKGDSKENLIHIVSEMLQFGMQVMPLVMLTWGTRMAQLETDAPKEETPAQRDFRLLRTYIEAEITDKRIRSNNPYVLTKLIFAITTDYVIGAMSNQQSPSIEEMKSHAKSAVEMIWGGIAPN